MGCLLERFLQNKYGKKLKKTSDKEPAYERKGCCCRVDVLRSFDTFQVISGTISYPIHTVPGQAS